MKKRWVKGVAEGFVGFDAMIAVFNALRPPDDQDFGYRPIGPLFIEMLAFRQGKI